MQQITKNLNNPLGKLDTSGGSIVNYAPSTGFYDTGAYMSSTTSSQAGSGGKSFTPGGFSYSPWVASYNAGPVSINFGNGYFGSTVIGSAVSAGEGLWKYTPPTNYVAFCTKNINSA